MTVLGASPDSITTLHNWREKEDLPYTLLSDPEHKVADLYGAWGEKKMYGKTYEGIIRSHFVINAEGKLEDVQYNVSPQGSIDEALRHIASS